VVGRAIQWLADVENEGLSDEDQLEHIPKERAVADVRFSHDYVVRMTSMSCLQLVWGIEGEFIPRQKVIH
jgi:hypothetical protein